MTNFKTIKKNGNKSRVIPITFKTQKPGRNVELQNALNRGDYRTATALSTLEWLGGINNLRVMIGAKDFVKWDNGIAFSFMGSRKANRVDIRLNGNDLYDITFIKIASPRARTIVDTVKTVMVEDNLEGSQLKGAIERFTGLNLSL